jgi:hypothetical protein
MMGGVIAFAGMAANCTVVDMGPFIGAKEGGATASSDSAGSGAIASGLGDHRAVILSWGTQGKIKR